MVKIKKALALTAQARGLKYIIKRGLLGNIFFWGVISYWGNNCILIVTKFDKICNAFFKKI